MKGDYRQMGLIYCLTDMVQIGSLHTSIALTIYYNHVPAMCNAKAP